jgi:hypothetical protein
MSRDTIPVPYRAEWQNGDILLHVPGATYVLKPEWAMRLASELTAAVAQYVQTGGTFVTLAREEP